MNANNKIQLQNLSHQNWDDRDLSGYEFLCNLTEKMTLRNSKLLGVSAHAACFTTVDFTNSDFSNANDITGSLFHGCKLFSTNFTSANMSGTTFFQSKMVNCNFSNSQLDASNFVECAFENTTFNFASLKGTAFKKCTFLNCNFNNIVGNQISFLMDCNIFHTSWEGADLSYSNFHNVQGKNLNFKYTKLFNSKFSNVSLEDCAFQSATAENFAIYTSQITNCLFSEIDGSSFKGRAIYFRDSNLSNSDFTGAYLYRFIATGDIYSQMNLRNCNFNRANLVNSYFCADLNKSNFEDANMEYCHLVQTSLVETNFKSTKLKGATIIKCDRKNINFTPFSEPALIL